MDKQEFLDGLRAGLQGNVSAGLVMENVNYYEDYINTEIRKGKTETEVLESLGDPRLIAKTIVQTQGNGGGGVYGAAGYRTASQGGAQYQSGARGYQGGARGYQSDSYSRREDEGHRSVRLPGWLVGVLVVIIMLLVLSFIFSVLTYLAPVILVIAAVVFVVKLFQDWLS